MKKLFFAFFVILPSLAVNAATSITTASVSGHWTLAGSPYKIFNDISINSGQSLIIDPGVSAIFQGPYGINVMGSLQANGSAGSPIIFDIQDTTGWHIDTPSNHSGGWTGINFYVTSSPASGTSGFSYCDFHHIKYGSMIVSMSMQISNCNFGNNRGPLLQLQGTEAAGTHEISNNNFFNNYATYGSLITVSTEIADWYIHDNNINNNHVGRLGSLVTCINSTLLFSKNNIHHNTSAVLDTSEDVKMLEFQSYSGVPCLAVVNGNKIYENATILSAPIFCSYAKVDFYSNYIANNHHVSASLCAHAYGGGGMFLMGNADACNCTADQSSMYTVRNNVIANNYSALYGGGIYIYNGKALIANNTIVNNKAPRGGGIDLFMIDTTTVCIRNNILWGNVNEGPYAGTGNVNLISLSQTNIKYDHNWTAYSFASDFIHPATVDGCVKFIGDSTANIITAVPGFVSPTLSADYTVSALTADFHLLTSSPCINAGCDSATTPGSTDYAGNNRIYGTSVDIGAYEFGSSTLVLPAAARMDTVFKYCCAAIKPYIPHTETSVTKVSPENDLINIYPNPASNMVFITTAEANGYISLFDVTGRKVGAQPVTGTLTFFDTHDLPRGIYFAVWHTSDGRQSTQKLFLE